jgi:ATP-binding cassette subfamily F protein uup
VVTQVIVLDGQGGVTENAGGYGDWVRYLESRSSAPVETKSRAETAADDGRSRPRPEKMSFKETRELASLPAQIEALEAEQADIAAQLADPALYKGEPQRVKALQARHADIEQLVAEAMARWDALEQKQARLNANTV